MATKEVTVRLSDTPKFIPPKVGGDAEFDGHGPNVRVNARLSLRNGRELWVRVSMHAKETKADYTEANGSADYLMLKHDKHVLRIVSDTYSEARYTANQADEDDILSLGEGELVREFTCTGDTKGREAGIKTGVKVTFNPVVLEVID